VDEPECVAITRDLFIVPVFEGGVTKNDGADARLVDFHAFNAVGGDCALRDGVFLQNLQAGRMGRRSPRSSCWPGRTMRGHNGRAGKEACLPRALPRGVQADAGAQCPPAILRACAPVGTG